MDPWVGSLLGKWESGEVETGLRGQRGSPSSARFIFRAVWRGLTQPCSEGGPLLVRGDWLSPSRLPVIKKAAGEGCWRWTQKLSHLATDSSWGHEDTADYIQVVPKAVRVRFFKFNT